MSAHYENDPEFGNPLPKPRPRRHFTLIELLAVVGVIGLLIALFLPAVRSSRGAARRAQCVNNLKQIGLALYNYEQEHGALPPAYTVDATGRPLHSWRTLILPYLEQKALYETIELSKPWDDPANAKARETTVHVYSCPSQPPEAPPNTTTYLATTVPNGCLIPGAPRRLSEVTDAPEATLLVIEASEENAVPWMAPRDAVESVVLGLGPKSKLHHPGGMNAALVDGSVRFLKADLPVTVRRALISIAGNDDPSGDQF